MVQCVLFHPHRPFLLVAVSTLHHLFYFFGALILFTSLLDTKICSNLQSCETNSEQETYSWCTVDILHGDSS